MKKAFLALIAFTTLSLNSYADNEYCQQLKAKFNIDKASNNTLYNMACCQAIIDEKDSAFNYLKLAVNKGFKDADWLKQDSDLKNLQNDPRWLEVVKLIEIRQAAYLNEINQELYKLYQEDQSDRQSNNIDWKIVSKKDEIRRDKVRQFIKENSLSHSDDYFHAAMIFQHGKTPSDYQLAHSLAQKSVELNNTNKVAKWLSCATEDRYLHSLGKPQVWGTQYKKENGLWTLEPFDRQAKSDKQRIACGVPTADESKAKVDMMNKAI
ncbi:TPR end-of-group domain-containing protein [Thalassotalea ganghwensis]